MCIIYTNYNTLVIIIFNKRNKSQLKLYFFNYAQKNINLHKNPQSYFILF